MSACSKARRARPPRSSWRRSSPPKGPSSTRFCGSSPGSTKPDPLVSRAAMRFFEYESRKILERERIPVAPGGYAQTADDAKRIAAEVGGSVVIKSQVLTGGRMKAGGVRFADTPEEA